MDQDTIHVNFGRPFPIFPMERVILLPHALIQLFIFEPRYRQMVEDVLDGSGQIAMASFSDEDWKIDYEGSPPIRPAVCLGQIIRHEANPDGTYRIWLQGICRARVRSEQAPDAERLYRTARLEPVDQLEPDEIEPTWTRAQVLDLLQCQPLQQMPAVQGLIEQLSGREDELSTSALLDLVGLSLLTVLDDPDLRYRLLAQGRGAERARTIRAELEGISRTLAIADRQFDPEAPKRVSWN